MGLDAIVGVFFTTSLALGSLLIEGEELLEAFLGDLEKITRGDVVLSAILAAVIVATLITKFLPLVFIASVRRRSCRVKCFSTRRGTQTPYSS